MVTRSQAGAKRKGGTGEKKGGKISQVKGAASGGTAKRKAQPKAKAPLTKSKTTTKGGGKGGSGAKKTAAKPTTPTRGGGGGRRGKSAEELEPDVEAMAKKAGVKLPKEGKRKRQEVEEAIKETSDRPYREYSKQEALHGVKKLKAKHKVEKPKSKGDPFSLSGRHSPRQKRGVNAPPPEKEKKKPPSKRQRIGGGESEMAKVAKEENRKLADAIYELSDFALHGDATQKGLSYKKAAKSIRESPTPIKSKKDAQKLTGVGTSIADKVGEFCKTGKIKVLEEYKKGERGM